MSTQVPMTAFADPLFGEADGYDGEGYDASGADRSGYDRDGNPVSVYAGDLNLSELWSASPLVGTEFLDYLRSITREPEAISDVVFCRECSEPAWQDDTSPVRGVSRDRVCENCQDDNYYSTCDHCGELYPDSETSVTLASDVVCENCLSRIYAFCNECDGYYDPEYDNDHDHDEDRDKSTGCCTSPQLHFTLRNGDGEPLAEDTRLTVEAPEGTITETGLLAIQGVIREGLGYSNASYRLAAALTELGDTWQTKEGNYPKRLSRLAYKSFQIKLSPELLARVGTVAREHTAAHAALDIEVTRDLNQSAYAFGHEDSCWWGSYSSSRCSLKNNGGFALRTFDGNDEVSGRAWVMPLRLVTSAWGDNFQPTFDTVTPDAFMVFNGYGELSGYTPARILAQMTGWTYRKTGFACEPMYINAGGYLVARENIARNYGPSSRVVLNIPAHSDLFLNESAAAAASKEY